MAYVSIKSAPGDIKRSLRDQMQPKTTSGPGQKSRLKVEKAKSEA